MIHTTQANDMAVLLQLLQLSEDAKNEILNCQRARGNIQPDFEVKLTNQPVLRQVSNKSTFAPQAPFPIEEPIQPQPYLPVRRHGTQNVVKMRPPMAQFHQSSFAQKQRVVAGSANNKIMERFKVIKQLGQGSFSTIFEAQDLCQKGRKVAIKVEKEDKSKKVLQFEYQVLLNIQNLKHVCKIFDFVTNPDPKQPNCIVMQLMGKNLANYKKTLKKRWTRKAAVNVLLQMLEAIEQLHNAGYIHRDIKPSNFVVGLYSHKHDVYMVDFGLAKQHLDKNGQPHEARKNTDFRGTITYASLNAHNKVDLSRRDDLWSFYFVILDFLNEELPWRTSSIKDEVRDIKTETFKDPQNRLWRTTTRNLASVKQIYYHISNLKYEDRPDYEFIRSCLNNLLEEQSETLASTTQYSNFQYLQSPAVIPSPQITPLQKLDQPQDPLLDCAMHDPSLNFLPPFNNPWMKMTPTQATPSPFSIQPYLSPPPQMQGVGQPMPSLDIPNAQDIHELFRHLLSMPYLQQPPMMFPTPFQDQNQMLQMPPSPFNFNPINEFQPEPKPQELPVKPEPVTIPERKRDIPVFKITRNKVTINKAQLISERAAL